ncbi:MAG TPA: dihydrofolate reductase family protein, partial [Candidatus Paceibacterota bacterium]|nr:dihydrofolate reductase family protein [Candidatus Paceibacterota bacterium]
SGRGSLSPEAEVFRHRHSPIVVLASEAIPGARLRALRAVADEVLIRGRQTVDWGAAFEDLEKRWGVRRLLAEGGARLNAALWAAGLVDELHLTICPRLFGGRASPTIADGPGASRLADAAQMELRSCCRVGDELFVVYGATGR